MVTDVVHHFKPCVLKKIPVVLIKVYVFLHLLDGHDESLQDRFASCLMDLGQLFLHLIEHLHALEVLPVLPLLVLVLKDVAGASPS